jgi:DNA-directed RNA polymerase specialized sigma subunit
MPTTLSLDDCTRQALFVLKQVAAFRGTMWEDDERQVALMAMVDAINVCKPEHKPSTQAFYIQQYVRGKLGQFRRAIKLREYPSETWTNEDGDVELVEVTVDAAQEADLEHREECEIVARAIKSLPKGDRETVELMLNSALPENKQKAARAGLSPQGFFNRRIAALQKLRELVGEGI